MADDQQASTGSLGPPAVGLSEAGQSSRKATGFRYCGVQLTLLLALMLPTAIHAQTAPLPTPAQFEPFADLSYAGFNFYNRLQAGVTWTDNVRLDPSEESDTKHLISLDSVARSDWQRHALAFTVDYAQLEAQDTPGQESESLSASVSGQIDVSETLSLTLGALRQESIVDKNNPMQFNGNLNGTTSSDTLEGSFAWDNEKHFVKLLARYEDVDNDTDINVTDLSRVQSQDRRETEGTLQYGRHYTWGQAYLLGGPQQVKYTGSVVVLPEDRDSQGGRLGVGVEFQQGQLEGIVRLIGFSQSFNAPTIATVTSAVGTAQLTYTISPQWGLAGIAERSFTETNIEGSGGLFTNLVGVGALHMPWPSVYVKLGPTYRFYQIAGTSLEATSNTLDLTLAWQAMDRVELLLNASVFDQTVNDDFLADNEYSENAATLSAVVTF